MCFIPSGKIIGKPNFQKLFYKNTSGGGTLTFLTYSLYLTIIY